MAVEPPQIDGGEAQGVLQHLTGLAGLYGGAELAVHLAGGHSVIGVGVYARGEAQKQLLAYALFRGDGGDGVQLLPVVHHEVAHPQVHGEGYVPIGLVVALEEGSLHGEARLHGGVQLPGGHGVYAHALLFGYLVNALEGVGLAGVDGQRAGAEALPEGFHIHAHVLPQPHLIHQVERGGVLLRQFHRVVAPEKQASVFPYRQIVANQLELCHTDLRQLKIFKHSSISPVK